MKIEKTEIQGLPTIYRIVIEEIVITDKNDIDKCKKYEDENNNTTIRCIACKYSKNSLFIDSVDELVRLESSNKPSGEDKRQTLIHFINEHFRIKF